MESRRKRECVYVMEKARVERLYTRREIFARCCRLHQFMYGTHALTCVPRDEKGRESVYEGESACMRERKQE